MELTPLTIDASSYLNVTLPLTVKEIQEAKEKVLLNVFEQIFKRKPTPEDKGIFTLISNVNYAGIEYLVYGEVALGRIETTNRGVAFLPSPTFSLEVLQ